MNVWSSLFSLLTRHYRLGGFNSGATISVVVEGTRDSEIKALTTSVSR